MIKNDKCRIICTSNFFFQRRHRDEYIETKVTIGTTTTNQPKLSTFLKADAKSKFSKEDPRQIEITNALLLYIAGDLAPLSVVDSPFFRNLMKKSEPRYQIPSRKYLSSKLLLEKSTEIVNGVKEQLNRAESVCLTVDLWSNKQMKGFLGITGHFILDWVLKSVMICCKRFKQKHTSENIRHEYEETVSSFDINKKITCVVSDNAANMVKAFDFSLPGFEVEITAIQNTDSDDDDDEDNDDNDDNFTLFDDDEIKHECLPKHARCYAHTLQLVVNDGLRECSSNLKSVIGKVSNVVKHVRKSVNASDILEEENRLQTATVTRWNSQLIMIRSVLKIPEEKLNKVEGAQKISSYERKLLSELCTILEPFEHATLLVQKERNVSASLPIPVTLGLKHQVKEISCDYSSKMVLALKSSIEKRLNMYELDDSYIISAVLDPRFKVRWCDQEKINEPLSVVKLKAAQVETVPKCTPDDDELSPPSKKAKPDFFSFMSPSRPKPRRAATATSELETYLTESCIEMSSNPLEYWNINSYRYPVLSKLAAKYLAIPATSAPVERLFSVAGKTFRPERCRLSDANFEKLMNIKCNSNIVFEID